MNYIIIEMQTSNGTTGILTEQRSDWFEALSVYFTKLSYAAISAVEVHSVVMLSDEGDEIMHYCCDHRGEFGGK